jgi:hypothetical protein
MDAMDGDEGFFNGGRSRSPSPTKDFGSDIVNILHQDGEAPMTGTKKGETVKQRADSPEDVNSDDGDMGARKPSTDQLAANLLTKKRPPL